MSTTLSVAAPLEKKSTLLRLDAPVPPSQVRKPRALKYASGSAAPSTDPSSGGGKGVDGRRNAPPLEDILNAILPPEPVKNPETGEILLRCVSAIPATRLDLVHLQDELDRQLLLRQARETGVCLVRSDVYGMAFDELIRQVTLECPERGLLLIRIRDEIRANINAHRLLYHSSMAFGSRKALLSTRGIAELQATVTRLEAERLALDLKVLELHAKCERIETDAQNHRAAEEKRHAEEVNFYRRTNQQLGSQVKTETDRANSKK